MSERGLTAQCQLTVISELSQFYSYIGQALHTVNYRLITDFALVVVCIVPTSQAL